MADNTRRVFFAFVPDAHAKTALQARVARLSWRGDARLRWLPSENWHVTLRFVGEVSDKLVDTLRQTLRAAGGRSPAFEMSLTAMEVFPARRRPLVVAATGPAPEIAQSLVAELEAGCTRHGLQPERRPWRPHLTLARVVGRKPLNHPGELLDLRFQVDRICLMDSIPTERGRRYEAIDWVTLNGTPDSAALR